MEIFIRIPFTKQEAAGNAWKIIKEDFADSFRFIRREKPVIGKALLVVCGMNLFLSSMLNVGLPYMVTEVLDLEEALANRLYGFTEGALAAGGLIGGISAGIFAKKFSVRKAGNLITVSAGCVLAAGIALMIFSSGWSGYIMLTICCFVIMIFTTIFSVEMLSFIQTETPRNLIGKVIAVVLTGSMCAQPAGNALYGVLFEVCRGYESAVVLFAGTVSLLIAVRSGRIFRKL